METKTVKITEQKTSSNGNQYLLVDFEDDTRMSCWDAKLFESLIPGKIVNVAYTVKGDFTTITAVGEAEEVVSATDPRLIPGWMEAEKKAGKTTNDPKHDSIVAQVILKGAVELCNSQSCTGSIGEQLALYVNELSGAYKLALSNVKAL